MKKPKTFPSHIVVWHDETVLPLHLPFAEHKIKSIGGAHYPCLLYKRRQSFARKINSDRHAQRFAHSLKRGVIILPFTCQVSLSFLAALSSSVAGYYT